MATAGLGFKEKRSDGSFIYLFASAQPVLFIYLFILIYYILNFKFSKLIVKN